MLWLLLLLLVAHAADPRVELVDLDGPWLEASPAGAAAGQWTEGTFPNAPEFATAQTAYRHYRRTLDFEPRADADTPVGLSVGFGAASYEIWADGERVGTAGDLGLPDGEPTTPAIRGRVFEVPGRLLDDGQLEIELRTGLVPGATDARLHRGVKAIGPLGWVRAEVEAAELAYTFRQRLPLALAAILIWGAGLWHLGFWWTRRDQRASLVFAGLAGAMGLGPALHTAFRSLPWVLAENDSDLAILAAACAAVAASVEFGAWFFRGQAPDGLGRGVQGLAVLGVVASLVGTWVSGLGVPDPTTMLAVLAVLVVIAVDGARAAARGNPDAWAVGVGFGLAGLVVVVTLAIWVVTGDIQHVAPAIFLGSTIVVVAVAVAVAGKYRRNLVALDRSRAAAMRFVPMDFLEVLEAGDLTEVKRGDARALELTVMFTDIRGFTTRSERYTAEENFAFVNAYLERMEPCIHDNGGFINQYLGDGVMALFRSADGAVAAALAMQAEVGRFSEDLGEEIRIGVGMNTGRVMLGTIGGRDRMDATIVSATQNLAARTEGMTKTYGVGILCTEHTRQALERPDAVVLRELDWVVAKGSAEKLAIYEVRAEPSASEAEWSTALAAFRRGDLDAARGALATVQDGPAALLLERIELLATDGLPADWDGVTRLRVK